MRRLLALLILCGCTAPSPVPGSPWKAGTDKVKITPGKFGWLTGYGNRNKPADGVAGDLWARVLAIEDAHGQRAVVVTADILGFPPSFSRSLYEEAHKRHGLRHAQVLLAASHTHAGPAVTERPSEAVFHGFDEEQSRGVRESMDDLREKMLGAIGRALGSMERVKAEFGRGEARYGMNRRSRNPNGSYSIKDNPQGPTDPDVPVLALHGKGSLKAVVFTYACHCTTLGGDFYKYHGDHAGVAAEELERAHPGATALFVAGCGGDINPSPRGKMELAVTHGQSLAVAVEGVLKRSDLVPLAGPIKSITHRIDLPLDKPPARDLLEKAAAGKSIYRQRHSREMLRILEAGPLPAAVPYAITLWKLADVTLVALSGEVCVDYALRLKNELGPERTWIAGYCNEVPCYIPSDRVLEEGGYEAGWGLEFGRTLADGSMMFYGWPVPFAAGLEERIVAAVRGMARMK